jgi:hypothetical protein
LSAGSGGGCSSFICDGNGGNGSENPGANGSCGPLWPLIGACGCGGTTGGGSANFGPPFGDGRWKPSRRKASVSDITRILFF